MRFLIAFVLALVFAAPTLAQTVNLNNQPVAEIIAAAQERTNHAILGVELVPEGAAYTGSLNPDDSPVEVLSTVLRPHGLRATLAADGTIRIVRMEMDSIARPVTPRNLVSQRVQPPTPRTRVGCKVDPRYAQDVLYQASSWLPQQSMDQLLPCVGGILPASPATTNVVLPDYRAAHAPGLFPGVPPSINAFAPQSSWYWNPYGYQYWNAPWEYGAIKIDGPDKFLQKVRVVIDGADEGVGSKLNNNWNQAVIVPVGQHVVEFVLEDDTGIWAFRRVVNVVPLAVQPKGKPLRVSGNEFRNAQDRYRFDR